MISTGMTSVVPLYHMSSSWRMRAVHQLFCAQNSLTQNVFLVDDKRPAGSVFHGVSGSGLSCIPNTQYIS